MTRYPYQTQESQINALEKQFVSESVNVDAANNKLVEEIASDLSNYPAIGDDLKHLSLTGANSPRETVYAIRHKLVEYLKSKSISLQIALLDKKTLSLEEALSKYEENRDSFRNRAQELQVKMLAEEHGTQGELAGKGPAYSMFEKTI